MPRHAFGLRACKGGFPLERRRIGSLEVSLAGLGCNNFGRRLDARGTREVVEAALEMGVTGFDTADSYGEGASERLLGQALGPRRESVVITTKFGMREPPEGLSGGHPRWVQRACAESLRRLGKRLHRPLPAARPTPRADRGDPDGAGRPSVQGKVREIGLRRTSPPGSSLKPTRRPAIAAYAPSPACRTSTVFCIASPSRRCSKACASLGLAFVPFFPLAMGLLSGKYRRGRLGPAGTRLTRLE